MTTKIKCLVVVSLIAVLDILPIPVMGIIAIFIVLTTPRWFLNVVTKLYEESAANDLPPQNRD